MRGLLCFFTLAYLGFPFPCPGVEPKTIPRPEVLEQLKNLPPNHGLLLGKAAVVGDFNAVAKAYDLHRTGPRGRDFTIKMAWAPDRKRALFCGANHGVPHRLNDVWEFDLPSLSWVLLYAPDNSRDYMGIGKDFSDVEFKDGILITKRGGPAVIAHTWWGLAYDPEEKALLFMNTWVTNQKKAVEQLGGNPAELYTGPPLWAFYPGQGRWKMLKTEKPHPIAPFGGMLEYIPELKGSIWHTNNWQMQATWLYDARKNAWTNLKANAASKDFDKQAPPPEQVGYYDPARRLVVVHRHQETFHYSPTENVWKKVLSKPGADDIPFGHDARAPMYHDPATGLGILIDFTKDALWSYNPDTITWQKLQPEGDPMPKGNKRLAYWDPAQNVLVVLEGVTTWIYRMKKG